MRSKELVVSVLVIATALTINPLGWQGEDAANPTLEAPGIVIRAVAAQDDSPDTSFLEQEAGIAAYVKVDQEIDIAQLRESFKVAEQLKDTYVTGQIPVPDLEENWHPRVFVTQDGWIVAYYPKNEPTSKILVRWITHEESTLTGTTLELAVREVLRNAPEVPVSAIEGIKYYHFQHPSADRIMLIREDTRGEDSFQLTIPSGLQVLDATWVASGHVGGWSGMKIDDEEVVGGGGGCCSTWGVRFGDLLPRLRVDAQQTVKVWRGNYGVLILYQAP